VRRREPSFHTKPADMRYLDQRPAKARGVSLHACHVDLPDDDAYRSTRGRSTLQAWKVHLPMDDGSSSTHGRSPLHACQDTARDNEHPSSMSVRSSRPTTRIEPDRFGDRHGYSGSPNLIASLVACIACRVGIEASSLGQRRLTSRQRSFDARLTKDGGPPGKPRCRADRGREFRSPSPGSRGQAQLGP
jgi:hypothetical protein